MPSPKMPGALPQEFARVERLPPYVFAITTELKMSARRRGEDIVDFGMGNPDGPTPPHIVAKLVETAQRGDTHGYSVSKGIPRLRRAICNWYKQRFDVDLDPETESIVTIGSKEGIAHLTLATLDRGDSVLVPNPSYPIHIYGPVIAGADVQQVPLIPGVDFFAELEKAIRSRIPKPKMLIINFPANPTTQCVELDFFERIVELAREYGIYVLQDLAYADICFDGWKCPSILQVKGAKDVAVEFMSMSKSYNMAGWRIGFMVGNKTLVNALSRIKGYNDYGTFTPIQVACIAALEGPQECVAAIRDNYQRRRDVLVKGLNEAGWAVEKPKATMFTWAKIPEQYAHLGSLEFTKKLMAEAKVSVSPGIGFGEFGDDHVRFAMIENEERTRQAIRGIKEMFRKG
ncbi:MAG: alanine transaminase [Alphaproteobacteria bacterium]|nr:alanine transaminase [Alphaproteobacteria bacterium]